MAKIDCRLTEIFLHEWDRMCGEMKACSDCPFAKEGCASHVLAKDTSEAVKAVQAWSDAHQQKTIMEDFLEKYPKAVLSKDGRHPNICPYALGFGKNVRCRPDRCEDCWSRPLSEVQDAQQDD